ncbi:glycoside hydrolase family 28 protein [Botryosphaeria dothidea]|uniref:endo-polygalacturonase n=1 Tax=Botryosphaeria dothidea TaxID=55169 RepID=A0A8H4J0Y6_9PEZI|nr:glycoside hydrolase family 28 protein [Botryosphaeria dothidea]
MVKASTLLLGAGAALAAAAPTELAERASCTFTDAASAIKGKSSCTSIVLNNIAVPAGTTLDLTSLKDGTTVTFQGTTSFGYKEWSGPLISVSGSNIKVVGASGHVIDGNGAKWWDGKGSNGGKTKPKFFYAHSLKGTSSIKGLNVKNTPVQGFSINSSSGLTLDSITIDNSAGDVTNGGHNTDAFAERMWDRDDCLAVNSGENIVFSGNTCSGGHGISIGSVGGRSDNTVKNVKVSNCSIKDSDNGIRIKTVSGATGSVSGVSYSGITLSNIAKYGIVIEQDYENGSPTGTPTTGVKGSVASKATDVYILCGKGSCSNWKWSGVSITGGQKSSKCSNIPSGSGASC